MINKLLVLPLILISSLAFAKDYKMDKGEFLSRLDAGTLTLERTPMSNFPDNLLTQFLTSQKKEFPGFKDEMFYVGYVKSTDYLYMVFYEYYDRGCVFGVSEPKKFQGTGSSDNSKGEMAKAELNSYQKIDKKYCEKVLNLTNLPSGGLTRVPGAVKPTYKTKK